MGRKGKTKNERKVNPKRKIVNRVGEEVERDILKELQSLRFNERPDDYDELVRLQKGRLKRAIEKQRRSENDTQRGKRGAK